MKTSVNFFYAIFATILLISCSNKKETIESENSLIEITQKQFTTDSMALSKIEKHVFEHTITCNGKIIPKPNGYAKINSSIPGIIKKILVNNGDYVTRGQKLAEISGNEFLEIQRSFAESAATFSRSKSEYNRVKNLYNEKVITEKDFVITESAYKIALANYKTLKMKIELLNLSTERIENGDFYQSFLVYSEIDGQITSITTTLGAFVDNQTEIMEVINNKMYQLQLSVFNKDISNLKAGQRVRFKSNDTNIYNLAIINSVGTIIDDENKSISCFADIVEMNRNTSISNAFIESEIITKVDTVYALPNNAILKTETGKKVLVLVKKDEEKYFFEAVSIKTGRENKGFTEVLDNEIFGQVLVDGVYNIVI